MFETFRYTTRVRSETSSPGQRILCGHGRVQMCVGGLVGRTTVATLVRSPPFPRPSRRLLSRLSSTAQPGKKDDRGLSLKPASPRTPSIHTSAAGHVFQDLVRRLRLGRRLPRREGTETTFCLFSSLARILIVALLDTLNAVDIRDRWGQG